MGQSSSIAETTPLRSMAMDVTKNTLTSTITQSNIIPINNMFINSTSHQISSFHFPCFEHSLKFYGFFTGTIHVFFNSTEAEFLTMNSDSKFNISRFEIYFKKDITNNNRIYIDSVKIHERNMPPRDVVNDIIGKRFETDIMNILLSMNDINTQVAYADIDRQKNDISFTCP